MPDPMHLLDAGAGGLVFETVQLLCVRWNEAAPAGQGAFLTGL